MENRCVVTAADSSSNTSARPVAARTKMILEAHQKSSGALAAIFVNLFEGSRNPCPRPLPQQN